MIRQITCALVILAIVIAEILAFSWGQDRQERWLCAHRPAAVCQ